MKELQEMMDPSSGLLWSPWFRIIAERFLIPHWWKDLKTTLTTDTYTDYTTIYRFDPTSEHMGGAGNAGSWLGSGEGVVYGPKIVGNTSLKQGAYGKVSIHKHSKLDQFSRLDEVWAALQFKYFIKLPNSVEENSAAVVFANDMLGKVSRSFAAVIRQLPKGLCLDILLFYLALRALDTIEDDMDAFKGRENEKIKQLCNFYQTGLVTKDWKMLGVGHGDERTLLEKYYFCVEVFKSLSLPSQEVIADITRRMGEGMASFVQKDLGQGTVKIADYNLYCHYVAGLVGEGLSRLFYATGYEDIKVKEVSTTLANTMGLFLQKTNIIRDYLEDYVDGRAFWPQEIWKLYAPNQDLGDFAKPENITFSLRCLNHLIMDALLCVPDCLEYMNLLNTEEVFRFCAIPQVMAIATLAELYNNPKVFTGVVKIRKGLTAKLILETTTLSGLYKWFYLMAKDILKKIPITDPDRSNKEVNDKTRAICEKILSITSSRARPVIIKSCWTFPTVLASVAFTVTGGKLCQAYRQEIGFTKSSSVSSFTFSTNALQNVLQQHSTASILFFGSAAIMAGYSYLSCSIKHNEKKFKKA
jgi:farnesyl-diphosphate farnesyltransferase